MNRKVIFLDIDGTLTEPGRNEPPASALEAIRKTREKGNYVYLCTGRNYGTLIPLLKYGFDGIVGSAGGYIVCSGEIIYDCPMSEEQKNRVLRILKEKRINRTVECLDGSYTDEGFRELILEESGSGGSSELLRWREQLEKELNIRPMAEYKDQPVYKVIIMGTDSRKIAEARKLLDDEFEFCFQDFDRFGIMNGELINRKFNKGEAVKRVCGYLNIPIEDTVAFGDSMNDRQMIEAAGLGICMENGSPELRKMADDICPSVLHDGLYKAFVKHGLI